MHPCGLTCDPCRPVSVFLFFYRSLHEALATDEATNALGKLLYLLDRILDGKVGTPGGAEAAVELGQGPGQGRAGGCRPVGM